MATGAKKKYALERNSLAVLDGPTGEKDHIRIVLVRGQRPEERELAVGFVRWTMLLYCSRLLDLLAPEWEERH